MIDGNAFQLAGSGLDGDLASHVLDHLFDVLKRVAQAVLLLVGRGLPEEPEFPDRVFGKLTATESVTDLIGQSR